MMKGIAFSILLAFGATLISTDAESAQRRSKKIKNSYYKQTTNQVRDLGGRPAACWKFPKTVRLWCGCASALEVGLANPDGFWNLSSNWFTLPRTTPGFNKAVVRHGHIAVLKHHVQGSIWMAYDPNSGGQRARLKPIDIRRYTAVVDPHGKSSRRRAELPVLPFEPVGKPIVLASLPPTPEPVKELPPKEKPLEPWTVTAEHVEPNFELYAVPVVPNILQRYILSRDIIVNPWVRTKCNGNVELPATLHAMLRDAASHFRCTVHVNSGYRDPAYNRRVGGARFSQHVQCKAVDFRVACAIPADVKKWLVANRNRYGINGIGTYRTHVHADKGTRFAMWNGGRSKKATRYAKRKQHRYASAG